MKQKTELNGITAEALQITAETLELLHSRGANSIKMNTNNDEVLIVHIHSESELVS